MPGESAWSLIPLLVTLVTFSSIAVNIYQICFSKNFIFVDPLFEADGDGLAATDGRPVGRPPDLDDWNLSTHLQGMPDDVTDLCLRD